MSRRQPCLLLALPRLARSGARQIVRALGATVLQWQERNVIFPVIEARLRYKSPARYDDLLAIEVWPTLIERVRVNFGHRVINQKGELVLEAETFHVCTGVNEKPKRLPENSRQNSSRI